MLQALLGCSHPCSCPQAQPHPSSRGNPDPGRYVISLARPLYGSGAWQCCTSPCHPCAQLFLGGSVSMVKALMRHAGLIICHLSIYLCMYLSSIYFCVYHLFICHLSIIYLSVYLSSSTYISTTYQLYKFLYLSYIYISIICLLMYLPPIDYISIIMSIIYQLLYPFIYLLTCLSSIIMCVCIYLCVCHPCVDVSVCEHATLIQSCPTLCGPMACSPPVFSVPGILQARILEWVAMPSSRGSSRPRGQTRVSCGSFIADGFFTAQPPGKPTYVPTTYQLSPFLYFSCIYKSIIYLLTYLSSIYAGFKLCCRPDCLPPAWPWSVFRPRCLKSLLLCGFSMGASSCPHCPVHVLGHLSSGE